MLIYLIIGLGNKGLKYSNTRHNIGYTIIDALNFKYKYQLKYNNNAYYSNIDLYDKKVYFIKPNSFINESGPIVNEWICKFKIPIDNLLVIFDDIYLPFGKIKINKRSINIKHNGIKSINTNIKSYNYPLLRFGIGSNFYKGHQCNYVLDSFNKKEIKLLKTYYITNVLKVINDFIKYNIQYVMNHYNNNKTLYY